MLVTTNVWVFLQVPTKLHWCLAESAGWSKEEELPPLPTQGDVHKGQCPFRTSWGRINDGAVPQQETACHDSATMEVETWCHTGLIQKSFRVALPLFHSVWNNIVPKLPQWDTPFWKKRGGAIRKVIPCFVHSSSSLLLASLGPDRGTSFTSK